MKCREAIRLMTYGRDAESGVRFALKEHASHCKKCSQELITNSAIKSVLDHYSEPFNASVVEQDVWQEARLINQVRARIQAAKENGLGTWESAIISVRGWLFAFAAAAIVLLALSSQSAFTRTSVATPQVEDLISNNTQLNSPREFNSDGADNVR